jgi:hypothetical protein
MPIIDLQRRIAEAGRIRIGRQVEGRRGPRPERLDTFRFTSADRHRLEQIAELYGGTVEPWQSPAGQQWEVISERSEIPVIVPPSDLSFSQWYELWSAAGCQRRCDGATEQISDGPCLCDPEQRECEIHTRLSLLLRDVPGLGVWRLDTQGFYAATELAAALQVITLAAGRGALLPARLRLEQRVVKRMAPGEGGQPKPTTLRFPVPVLDIEVTPAQILSGAVTESPKLRPVPQLEAAVPSIAEQSEPPPAPQLRSVPIPPSGRRRSVPAEESPAEIQPPAEESAPAEEEGASVSEAQGRRPECFRDPEQYRSHAHAHQQVGDDWYCGICDGMTRDEFLRRVGTGQVPRSVISAVAKELYPMATRLSELSDVQRAHVWAVAEERAGGEA